MFGIEEAYCNTAIGALLRANYALLESTVDDALQTIQVRSKEDTLGLDAKPEITISEHIQDFDQYATLLSEERGEETDPLVKHRIEKQGSSRSFFICDPTDRSSQLRAFLKQYQDKSLAAQKVSDILLRTDCQKQWAEINSAPSSITGAFSAITCIRRGSPICSVLLNYITQELFVACSAGTYKVPLPTYSPAKSSDSVDLKYCVSTGEVIYFTQPGSDYWTRFVTYLGKGEYGQNLLDTKLIEDSNIDRDLHYDLPGGPSRILYLSNLQPADHAVGFIIANGEKIGEWIHWLAFSRFSKMREDQGQSSLRVFETYLDRPWTRDGIMMSTSPIYSIFKVNDPDRGKKMVVDVARFNVFPNPTKYRGTLLVVPKDNQLIIQRVQQYGHRPIMF